MEGLFLTTRGRMAGNKKQHRKMGMCFVFCCCCGINSRDNPASEIECLFGLVKWLRLGKSGIWGSIQSNLWMVFSNEVIWQDPSMDWKIHWKSWNSVYHELSWEAPVDLVVSIHLPNTPDIIYRYCILYIEILYIIYIYTVYIYIYICVLYIYILCVYIYIYISHSWIYYYYVELHIYTLCGYIYIYTHMTAKGQNLAAKIRLWHDRSIEKKKSSIKSISGIEFQV